MHIQDLFNVKQHSLSTKQYYVFLQEKKIIFTEPPNADGCEFKFALEVSVHFIIIIRLILAWQKRT